MPFLCCAEASQHWGPALLSLSCVQSSGCFALWKTHWITFQLCLLCFSLFLKYLSSLNVSSLALSYKFFRLFFSPHIFHFFIELCISGVIFLFSKAFFFWFCFYSFKIKSLFLGHRCSVSLRIWIIDFFVFCYFFFLRKPLILRVAGLLACLCLSF